MSEETTPNVGLTLDQAFEQLKASRQQTPEEQPVEDEETEVAEELEEEFDEEEFEEESEESDDDDQEDDEEEAEDDDSGEEDDDVFEVEVDGETVEVTGEELRKGYLRHQDYTRKRQADAKQAKELKTEYDAKIAELNQALAANISQEQQQFQQLQAQYAKETDGNKKRDLHYKLLQVQQSLGQRANQLQQAQQLKQQVEKAKQEAYWNEQQEHLQARYENWDEKKSELVGYLTEEGFEDLSMFAHHKMAELVDKAKQFDELQQKRKVVQKKKLKRKVPKVMKPGQGERKLNVNRQKVKQLEAQFAKTGSIKDAIALRNARQGK